MPLPRGFWWVGLAAVLYAGCSGKVEDAKQGTKSLVSTGGTTSGGGGGGGGGQGARAGRASGGTAGSSSSQGGSTGGGSGSSGTGAGGSSAGGGGNSPASGGASGSGGSGAAGGSSGTAGTSGSGTSGTGGAVGDYPLPDDRGTLWKPGVTYNGGIPGDRTVYKTLTPRGSGDDSSQIQSALDSCPDDQIVQLDAGTFQINNTIFINKSNITLRGAGPGKTILKTNQDQSIIFIGTLYYNWVQQTTFTEDAVKDSYSVKLSKDPGLKVGELVHVDETYDSALTWFNQDTGQSGDYQGWGEGRKGPMNQSRPIGQAMVVDSITDGTVTFTTPFHMNYRVSHAAHLARIAGGDGKPIGVPVHDSGIEELTLDGGGGGDQGGNVRFAVVDRCWAKHIESTRSQSSAFAMDGSVQCELRDSYIHSTQDPNPGGGGYGIVVDTYAADNLIENNISWNFNKVMVMRSSGGGNVIGYNLMQDSWGEGYPTLPETGINASHMATPQHELFEGNESHNFGSDTTWGNSLFITVFRNHLTGIRLSATPLKLSDQGNRRCAEINIQDKWFTFIGNVLGSSDMPLNAKMPGGNSGQTQFAYEAKQDNDSDARIWQLMYADDEAQATLLRLGNFDWATKSQKWPGLGGIGTPDAPPNPLPDIPPSLYVPSKPAFMGSNPWPWVNPETGETNVLPARARFDAGSPNDL